MWQQIVDFIMRWLSPQRLPMSEKDVDAELTKLAAQNPEHLDWKHSIVDLMKLMHLDSSLAARYQLAKELGYPGERDGSAEMNLWLIKEVRRRIAEHKPPPGHGV
jgi:Domain of unknown function (DUF3597)